MIRAAAFVLAGSALIPVLPGCGGGAAPDPGASGVFIAFARDFEGFSSWTAFELGDDQDDGIAVVGHRRLYINQLPPTGSSAFPVGTIVVKTIGEELPTPGQVFAMAKRGGSFNASGAIGWEWFELLKTDGTTPLILWRGITPPAGERYAGVAGGVCNTCHVLGRDNDFVPSPELLLSQF
jgi:hypothetical protein